jgi:polysaccharide biosynthesis/export protein ExoF
MQSITFDGRGAAASCARSRRVKMRPPTFTLAIALAAFSVFPAYSANDGSLGGDIPGATAPTAPDSYRLDSGDRLRIRFFDRFDRDDLNGEYILNERGELRLPRFGNFEARNKSTQELERAIQQSIEKRGEKPGDFSIEIAQCRPFYVSGLANHPGGYAFVPGFTVMHAVSLAGGLYRSPMASVADAMREKRGLTETLDRLASLYARRARLQAEREESATIATPPELTQLAPARTREIIESERSVMQRLREVEARDRSWLQDVIALSNKEAEDYKTELTRVAQRIQDQTKVFEQMRKLQEDKIINQQRFSEVLIAFDSIQRDKQLAASGLSVANHTLQKAERDLSLLTLAKNARVAKELTETADEISRLKTSADETRRLASGLEALATEGGSGDVASYRIMRRNEAGEVAVLAATETTPIMPGDVVQIDRVQTEAGSLF